MKIELKLDAKPVKSWRYRLSSRVTVKLKEEIDTMIVVFIFLIHESKWISLVVI